MHGSEIMMFEHRFLSQKVTRCGSSNATGYITYYHHAGLQEDDARVEISARNLEALEGRGWQDQEYRF